MSKALADFLLREKMLTQAHLDSVQGSVTALIQQGVVNETALAQYLGQKFHLSVVNLEQTALSVDVARLLPPNVILKFEALPVALYGEQVTVVVWDPTVIPQLESARPPHIQFKMALSNWSAIHRAIQKLNLRDDRSAPAATPTKAPGAYVPPPAKKTEIRRRGSQSVEGFLAEALNYGASDIHVESLENKIRVRIRVDGVMHVLTEIAGNLRDQIISKIKVMAGLDMGERRLPQDGKFKYTIGQQNVDIRVNSAPTVMGESVVLRVLRQDHQGLSVARLAMLPEQEQQFRAAIEAPNGIVLVSGPTGSGKTTTLYSALMELNRGEEKIATVEDPVEYNIDGITQIQVKKDIGLTFSSALRALLRQDPDILLVGEIRDKETAEVAVQAALTGHLVMSSLHSNDAVGTVLRLVNLGVDPLTLASALNIAVAQRLVRRICPFCKQPAQATSAELQAASKFVQIPKNQVFYSGQGCEDCLGTGFKGRIAIYEMLPITDEIREMLGNGATALAIQKRARELGILTMQECAVIRAMHGDTALIEALSSSG